MLNISKILQVNLQIKQKLFFPQILSQFQNIRFFLIFHETIINKIVDQFIDMQTFKHGISSINYETPVIKKL